MAKSAPMSKTLPSLTAQSPLGGYNKIIDGTIIGWSWYTESFSWLEPTAFGVISLVRCGHENHPRVKDGRALIKDRVCTDGGWNYGNGSILGTDLMSYQHSTGWALLALPKGDELVAAGIKRLRAILETPSTLSLSVAALAAGFHGVDPSPWLDALRARQSADGSFGLGRVDRTALAATALRMEKFRESPLTGVVEWGEPGMGVEHE